MLDIFYLPQNFCIGHYIPKAYWPHEDDSQDGYTEFVLDLKRKYHEQHFQAIQECIRLLSQSLCGFDAVAVVPSSKPNAESGIYHIAAGLAKASERIDATSCLKRHTAIPSHSSQGSRPEKIHLQSIGLHYPVLVKDKAVLLLDDVRTTGNSLRACQNILEKASPKLVISLALAQTWHPDEEADSPAILYSQLKEKMNEFHIQEYAELEEKHRIELAYLMYQQEQGHDIADRLFHFAYG
ncbi:phosphoribosyltransferase [Nodosilinea sp. FACHB-131]|uniref:phosphoribosyltransferase n=1 Tax=Cyanophyceae TaxID=3028117 RepID=UPI0016837C10|nr:phosphoribosyltransferase [Nodosilinea sp. FACHB-131]MBD1877004.1 phosphoribosyltransferase [Nodosilinea sp. FACHB-131]